MTTDQAVPTDGTVEAPRIGVPDIVMINALRDEIAVLNDERIRNKAEIIFANQVIASLQAELANHSHDHVHEEFDS
jgi:hypothetical protein